MPTSAADFDSQAGDVLLVYVGEAGTPDGWLLIDDGVVVMRGGESEEMPLLNPEVATALAVPGSAVTIHWLDLAGNLSAAQAAAAARLMLADASAEPMAEMHVAVGVPEQGLTPVAMVASRQMAAWLNIGLDPDLVIPQPMLLHPPAEGFATRAHGALGDYRAPATAFTIEPELADAMIGSAPVVAVDGDRFEAGLPALLAAPPLNLRQGPFARRRQWVVERGNIRRIAMLALALAALTLLVQIVTILSFAFAADRAEAELATLSAGGSGGVRGAAFGPVASVLVDAVRSTPNVELTRIDYRADGSLVATVLLDVPASLAALRARIEAGGLRSEAGEIRSAGGRPAADLTVRPS